jgi:hypothetical protein
MHPDSAAWPAYVQAFTKIALRIQDSLPPSGAAGLPVRMYLAGGSALHFYTGARFSDDIDAVFSRRVVTPVGLQEAYDDADGSARLLYFDTQYNDTLALMHEDAYEDSRPLELTGVDETRLEVRVLDPVDLAISKLARFTSQDREDISLLAQRGLVSSRKLRRRAEEALVAFIGDTGRLRGAIDTACGLIDAASPKRGR